MLNFEKKKKKKKKGPKSIFSQKWQKPGSLKFQKMKLHTFVP